MKAELLSSAFLRAAGATEEGILRSHLGVPLLDLPTFYQDHLFPRMGSLGGSVQVSAAATVLGQLGALQAKDPSFAASLKTTAFVPANDDSLR